MIHEKVANTTFQVTSLNRPGVEYTPSQTLDEYTPSQTLDEHSSSNQPKRNQVSIKRNAE